MHRTCIGFLDLCGKVIFDCTINNTTILCNDLWIESEHDHVSRFKDKVTILTCTKTRIHVSLGERNGCTIRSHGDIVNLDFSAQRTVCIQHRIHVELTDRIQARAVGIDRHRGIHTRNTHCIPGNSFEQLRAAMQSITVWIFLRKHILRRDNTHRQATARL